MRQQRVTRLKADSSIVGQEHMYAYVPELACCERLASIGSPPVATKFRYTSELMAVHPTYRLIGKLVISRLKSASCRAKAIA